MNAFFVFDSQDSNGMHDPKGTALVMKFTYILEVEQHLNFLSIKLHTNLFEIVLVQLMASETNSEKKAILCKARHSKKKITMDILDFKKIVCLRKENGFRKVREFKRRRQYEKTDSERQIRLQKDEESKKRKHVLETDSERQLQLEKG